MKTHQVQVWLTDEQHDWLKEEAERRILNVSQIVRELIDAAREKVEP